jgi:NAD+ kinase
MAKPGIPEASTLMPELIGWLRARHVNVQLDEEAARYTSGENGLPREKVPEGAQLVIVLGGDGTLLAAA